MCCCFARADVSSESPCSLQAVFVLVFPGREEKSFILCTALACQLQARYASSLHRFTDAAQCRFRRA